MTDPSARLPLVAAAAAMFSLAAAPNAAQTLSGEALLEALGDGGYVVVMNLPAAAPAPAAGQGGGAFGGGRGGFGGGPAAGGGGRGGFGGGPAADGGGRGGAGPAAGGGGGSAGGPGPGGGGGRGGFGGGGGRGGGGGGRGGRGGFGGGGGGGGGGLADMEDAQMIAVSFAFRELEIPVGTFYMGGDARSAEAARLFYFGDQQTVAELDGNGQASFVTGKVGETPAEGKNTVVLAPQASITSAFSNAGTLQAFETLIFKAGSTTPVARLTPKDWATLALE